MRFPCFKAYFLEVIRIGVHFIKYDIHGVFLKYAEILPTMLWDNVEDQKQLKKIVAQKINVILFFDRIFKIFFPSSTLSQ
jgi:hypothetical protein